MKLHRGKVISEDDADGRLEHTPLLLDSCPTKGHEIWRWTFYLSHLIALTRNSCSLSREPKEIFCNSHWQCQTALCQAGYCVVGSQFPASSRSSSLFARSGPSHLWIFAYLKGVLQGSSFDEPDERDELLSGVQENLKGVDRELLDAVFQEWMIRL
jgi:hypothetical protein